jgi:hypothetical protein
LVRVWAIVGEVNSDKFFLFNNRQRLEPVGNDRRLIVTVGWNVPALNIFVAVARPPERAVVAVVPSPASGSKAA